MQKIILTILLLLTFSSIIFADQEGSPTAYTAETADKKHIFVMLTPNCNYCWGSDKYKQSGMYLNDGSTTPLWTVDWQRFVFLPNGGKYVIRHGDSKYSATYREEIFSFVSEGKILKTYKTTDIVDFPWLLPHTASHYGVIYSPYEPNRLGDEVTMKINEGEGYTINKNVKFDDANSTILIENLHSDKYLFDLETGNIISAEHPTRNAAIKLFCLVLFVYFVYLYTVLRVKLSKSLLRSLNLSVGFFLTVSLFLIPIISVSVHQFVPKGDEFKGYPGFWAFCYLSIQTFPRYLLASLNLVNLESEDHLLQTHSGSDFVWLITFWIPCILLFGILTHFLTTSLNKFHKTTN